MNLTTDYLGIKLRNPFVVGASPIGDTFQTAYELQDLGAAAIVMRSLFPEQLPSSAERDRPERPMPGAAVDFPAYAEYQLSPEAYLKQVETLKKMLTIPVVASLNGHRPMGWKAYASRLEVAGADAIELNFYQVVTNPAVGAGDVEGAMRKTVGEVVAAVRIPVAVKLSPFHASVAQLAVALEEAGAAGVVIFNRFYQPDINPATVTVEPHLELSTSAELLLRLRWLAILSPLLRGTVVAGGGVHTPEDVVKALLAGAHAVQLVSVLLRHGPSILPPLIEGLQSWMKQHGHPSIESFRGRLNLARSADPTAFERANYIRILNSRTI